MNTHGEKQAYSLFIKSALNQTKLSRVAALEKKCGSRILSISTSEDQSNKN